MNTDGQPDTTDGPDVTLYCHPDEIARARVAAVRAYGDDTTWDVLASPEVAAGRLLVVSRASIKDLLAGAVADPQPARHWQNLRRPSEPVCGHPCCPTYGPCGITPPTWSSPILITGV